MAKIDRITNDELEKFGLNFSRCANRGFFNNAWEFVGERAGLAIMGSHLIQ